MSNTPTDALPVAARLYTGLALAFTPAGLSLPIILPPLAAPDLQRPCLIDIA